MSLQYVSTRAGAGKDNSRKFTASEAIIKGLADDGGLFVPVEIPQYKIDFESLKNIDYKRLAFDILSLYLDFTKEELNECIESAYSSGFDDPNLTPLQKKGDCYFLELFHGRTLAFKDMALSILPYLMTTAKKKLNIQQNICILAATSGDTGKAALAGFADVPGTVIIVFYPNGGVSDIQRLQMVTQEGKNVYVYGINGNFDDAQKGVKNIFSSKISDNCNYLLSSANSINIGRLLPQIIYYYYTYAQMLKNNEIKRGEAIDFVVPTGNFGNILAGYYAKKMGLPIGKLICASNSNNVLYDFFTTGKYDSNREFILTVSPSMDILVSSNLERLLYDLSGKDSETIRRLMDCLSSEGKYEFLPNSELRAVEAGYADETETREAIREMYENGYVIDTHTAVAYAVLKKHNEQKLNKTIILSTASPYKFASDVCCAIDGTENKGFEALRHLESISNIKIPDAIGGLDKKEILHSEVIDKGDMANVVTEIISEI